MINTDFIKNNFLNLIVLILLGIVLFQTCGGKSEPPVVPTVKRDTVWIHTDSTVYSKPQVIKTEPYPVPIDRWNTEYLPDTNYTALLKQYETVVKELLAKNISSDSLKIDSIGYVHVTDTVSKNVITGRSYKYSVKYPIITNTITIPEKKKNQLYIGGILQAENPVRITQLSAGLLFKNKKDHIYGAHAGFNTNGQIIYGVHSYWKIRLRK